MYSDNTVMKMNDIAQRYKDVIHQAIHDVLSQDRYKNTGAGVASLVVEVIDGDANKSPQIRISFDDHLILLDKRKMQWTKLPNMRKLLEWAETVKPDKKQAKRLAWAVAWDKKNNDTWKGKPWRKKSLSNVLKEMNLMIKEAFDQALGKDFQEAANGK
jgi:hypothetical protein